MLRVEEKYRLTPADFHKVRELIGAVMEMDRGRQYKISSLYFDDLYDTDLTETVAGNPQRQKMRVRIYDDSFSLIKLEVKNKWYSKIEKFSELISYEDLQSLLQGKPIAWDEANSQNPRNAFNKRILTAGLRPKVIVTYERSAFCYDFGNTRITFDEIVRASNRIELFGHADLCYDYSEESFILEVKYDQFLPNFAVKLLNTVDMEQTSFSKYRLCREQYELIKTGGLLE